MQIYLDINYYLKIDATRLILSFRYLNKLLSFFFYIAWLSIIYVYILDQKLCQTRSSIILQLQFVWIGANSAIRYEGCYGGSPHIHPRQFVLVCGVSDGVVKI